MSIKAVPELVAELAPELRHTGFAAIRATFFKNGVETCFVWHAGFCLAPRFCQGFQFKRQNNGAVR